MKDIVLEVPAGYTGTVRIVITAPGALADSSAEVTIDSMLDRFEEYDSAAPHRALADYMEELGFTGALPKPRSGEKSQATYVRWTFKGPKRSVSLYQNSAGLICESEKHLDFALTVPGANPVTKPRVLFYYAELSEDGVSQAAEKFREYAADGGA